ncbi:MAG: UvrD-helicase domain-containing protein [Acidimicrobiaceae bacterium]|nr:UvrD-helicase domain-containing protein [Acidimicrobiaceae bacterium]
MIHDKSPSADASILEGLNEAQLEAVIYTGGPLLVVAGAGSGKTRALTHRIAYLMQARGLSPHKILAITFTNKAAEEMKSRVRALVGLDASKMWVSTFHSACLRILRKECEYIGYPPQFTIYDKADTARLCRYVLKDLGIDIKRVTPRKTQASISALKNNGTTAKEYSEMASNSFEQRLAEVFVEYQRRLVAASAMDFDDILQCTVELFRNHDAILDWWRNRFQHVFVDEYQDTNTVQNRLVIQLTADHGQITAVGDSDQSIYRFRGADVRNILEFEAAFPNVHTVVLEQNYRSTQNILNAANALIANNSSSKTKNLWSDLGEGQPISVYRATDERDEVRFVVEDMIRRHEFDRIAWEEMAVLYRTNAQSRILEEQLVREGIPYLLVRGTSFYERREIRDAVAYLKAAANPADEVSVKRVLNTPKRGVGQASIGKVEAYAADQGITFFDALTRCQYAGVKGRAAAGIRQFYKLIRSANQQNDPPHVILDSLLESSGYLLGLRNEATIEAEGRIENLEELLNVASEHDTVEGFLERIALAADTDALPSYSDHSIEQGEQHRTHHTARSQAPDLQHATQHELQHTSSHNPQNNLPAEPKVSLMTLHAAKGLEYPVVYLVGMEDGILPGYRSFAEPEQMQEERRLAYVGITRAMRLLTVTYARCRQLYGSTQFNQPSRFLAEIPDDLIVYIDKWYRQVTSDRQTTDDCPTDIRSGLHAVDRPGQLAERIRAARRAKTAGVGYGYSPSSGFQRQPRAGLMKLRVGDDVRHEHWGEGVVMSVSGSGNSAEAVIRFLSEGEKRLLLSFAPLERIR